jgi:hypothetical protein
MAGLRVERRQQAGMNWALLAALVLCIEVWAVAASLVLERL